MKIAVTGGSGRIGRSVLETLVARGHEVINMDRRPATDRPGRFIYTELNRREMVQPALEQVEAVIHMGEIPSARGSSFNVEELYGRNTAAGAMVMQIAGELKLKKLIYASTVQVYGFCDIGHVAPLQMPIDETHPIQPQNMYALSKAANERYCRLVSAKMGLSAAIFRFPWVLCSESDDNMFKWVEMRDDLDEGLGVYVKDQDVADALALAVEDHRPGCQTYNLSANDVLSARPIREAMELKFPDYPKLPADWPKYKSPYLADKAKQDLSWQPKFNLLDEFRKKYGRDPKPPVSKGA